MSPGTAGAASGRPPSDSRLPTSGHLLLTCHGERPPWRPAVAFLSAGLAGDRRLVYLHDRSDPGEIADWLRGEDLDFDRLVAAARWSAGSSWTSSCMYPAEQWDDPVVDATRTVHGEHYHRPGSAGGKLERVE